MVPPSWFGAEMPNVARSTHPVVEATANLNKIIGRVQLTVSLSAHCIVLYCTGSDISKIPFCVYSTVFLLCQEYAY